MKQPSTYPAGHMPRTGEVPEGRTAVPPRRDGAYREPRKTPAAVPCRHPRISVILPTVHRHMGIFLLLLLLSTGSLCAQAPYLGADGDGYARAEGQFQVVAREHPASNPVLHLSPNPSHPSETATLHLPEAPQPRTLEIWDLTGKCLRSLEIPAGATRQDLPAASFPPGSYLLRLRDGGENPVISWRVLP